MKKIHFTPVKAYTSFVWLLWGEGYLFNRFLYTVIILSKQNLLLISKACLNLHLHSRKKTKTKNHKCRTWTLTMPRSVITLGKAKSDSSPWHTFLFPVTNYDIFLQVSVFGYQKIEKSVREEMWAWSLIFVFFFVVKKRSILKF